MAFDGLLVKEIFHSLQGETSMSGLRFAFIRLSGCNLRCSYCDSAHAFHGGERLSIDEILNRISEYRVRHVLLTGGEPLLQRNTLRLIEALNSMNYRVSIETHGEVSIAAVSPLARIVMDIKTPGSGMCRGGFKTNIAHIKAGDEIKFVLTSKKDYEWSRSVIQEHLCDTPAEILLSHVVPSTGAPSALKHANENATSSWPYSGPEPSIERAKEGGAFDLKWLAEAILKDRLNVRLQTQLHKIIWGPDQIGV
jgi:7-carboxy-7-deazaguanine synthase